MLHAKTIGNKIAEARKKWNMTQAELAHRVSISPQAVGKWERGESMPDIQMLDRLAEIFRVDLNYFSDGNRTAETEVQSEESDKEAIEMPRNRTVKKFDWNWDMSRGNWIDADFSGLKNLKEKFSSSNMKNCKFLHADMSGLLLAKNNIELCDFSGSDMRESRIQSSNILNDRFGACSFIDALFLKSNIEKCDFSGADFSGAEMEGSNLEGNIVQGAVWKFTKFVRVHISNMTFTGTLEDCHFEHCSFYKVAFENATILNTFFKYNDRFKKVQFTNCTVDSITYAFLKNNQANLSGITVQS